MVQLTDELVGEIDREAARRRQSRSALIREILDGWLEQSESRRIGEAIAEGYRRIPQDTPDEWGDLMSLSDANARDVAARLDEEERRAGFGPWE